jgi:hypothetical protein
MSRSMSRRYLIEDMKLITVSNYFDIGKCLIIQLKCKNAPIKDIN